METVLSYSKAGRVLFMLDGLDELKESHRKPFMKSAHQFYSDYPGSTMVISSRPHAIGSAKPFFGTRHCTIPPLTPEQKDDFIRRWFESLSDECSQETLERSKHLIDQLNREETINEIVDTPLMLTAICILYMDDKELPEQRADLYERVVNNLVKKKFSKGEGGITPELVHELIGKMALFMMEDSFVDA